MNGEPVHVIQVDYSERPGLRELDAWWYISPEDWLPRLAKDAMNQTRLLVNNPRPVGEADALAIYRTAY